MVLRWHKKHGSEGRGTAALRRIALVAASLLAVSAASVQNAGAAPSNDDFANATVLSGTVGTFSGTTVGGTHESTEYPWNFDPPSSVWLSWTAPSTGTLNLTMDCEFYTFLSIYEEATEAAGGNYRTLDSCLGGMSPNGVDLELLVQAGLTYSMQVESGVDSDGFDNTGTFSGSFSLSSVTSTSFKAVTPTRLLDTRQSSIAGPASNTTLTVAGVGSIPAAASAVVLNVTTTATTRTGFLTVYPAGSARPTASNMNWTAGTTTPALVIATVGTSGQIKLYNSSGNSHIVVDVMGYFSTSASDGPQLLSEPTRFLDTRTGTGLSGTFGSGQSRDLQITGRFGVPTGATAAVVNLTTTGSTNAGYLTAWPAGAARPTASVLNRTAGQTVANLSIVPIGTGGKISLFNSNGTTHVIADVLGYMTPTSPMRYVAVTPRRMLDTRNYFGLGFAFPLEPQSTGNVGVSSGMDDNAPSGASYVMTNLTGVVPTSRTFLTIFGADPMPGTSNLNLEAGKTRANAALVAPDYHFATIYNYGGNTNVLLDLSGYFWDPNGALPAPALAPAAPSGSPQPPSPALIRDRDAVSKARAAHGG